jgi:hypothetical protein
MNNIGSSLDTQLRSRAQNLHANSTQLEKQQKDLVKATEGLRKENEKLKKVADDGAKRVKELGNVQNWAEMLERDFLVLEETLRLANKGSDSEGSEGSWESDESGSVTDDEERLRGIGIFGQRMGDWVDEGDGSSLGEESRVLDREGDTAMEDTVVDGVDHMDEEKDIDHMDNGTEHLDKGKGKEIERELAGVEQQTEITGGSSTATATTGSGSGSDPSSSSVHTAASAAS